MTGVRVAIIGSRGIPARYGGFETLVEELAPRLVALGHDVTVYCRAGYSGRQASYRGVRLVQSPYLPIRSLETLSHEAASILDSLRRPLDAYYFLGTRSAPLYVPLRLSRRKVLVHTDGIEWKRRKWSAIGRTWLKASESIAARVAAQQLVTDAEAMRDYYLERYGVASACIPYGTRIVEGEADVSAWSLSPGGYHLVVCRLEPENNVDLIIQAFIASGSDKELVVVGDAGTRNGRALRRLARGHRIRFLGPVYGPPLDDLRLGAATYVHGHEVGGLNPSLLEAMGAGACCLAKDTPFAREALGAAGRYWGAVEDLARLLAWAEGDPGAAAALGSEARERARGFDWDQAAASHDALLRDLVGRSRP